MLGVIGENLVGLERVKNCLDRESGTEAHAGVEFGRVLLRLGLCWAVKRPMKNDTAEMRAAPMSVPEEKSSQYIFRVMKDKYKLCSRYLPITAPALAPGLRDFNVAPKAALPVAVLFVPAVVHFVRGVALKTAALEESGTLPRAAKPG